MVWSGSLKRKILIALIVIGALLAAFVFHRERADHVVTYQGKRARVWAMEFSINFDPRSTNAAMTAFHIMGSNAVPELRAMLKTREPWYGKLLMRQGKSLPTTAQGYLVRTIKPGQTVSMRIAAARALGVIGTNAISAVPDLALALGDIDVRWAASQALASIGGSAIPALAIATTNKDANTRHAAVYGLGQAGTNAVGSTTALLDAVRDPSQAVQASALYSLGQIGRSGLPSVLAAFSTDSAERRDAATRAIKAMNNPPRQVLSALLEFPTNSSPELRRNSLEALQSLHLNHPRVVTAYFEAMNDSSPGVRASAARALGQARVWATNAALSEATVRLLGRSGSLDGNAQTELNGLLDDPEPSVREAAQQSLADLRTTTAN